LATIVQFVTWSLGPGEREVMIEIAALAPPSWFGARRVSG
jgi:hypothetical protein